MASKAIGLWHTYEQVSCELRYEPLPGEFWWLRHRRGRQFHRQAGSIVICRGGQPARVIMIDGRRYYANVLAWLLMTKEWPDREVDHINTNSLDNRWSNLRLGTHAENNRNKDFTKAKGAAKLLGAHFHKASGLWKANLQHKTLGYFKTAEEAHEVYKEAARKTYGSFAHSTIKNN